MKEMLRNMPSKAKSTLFLLGLVAIFAVVKDESSVPLLNDTLRGNIYGKSSGRMLTSEGKSSGRMLTAENIHIPPSLDAQSKRRLSLNLGNGQCKWQPPDYARGEDTSVNYHKTLIAGFPSGDKRMIFTQMEALTGLPAKDEWDFEFIGDSNHPFIKANYPHHEGIWGWGDNADQVVMMIRNIRRSMVEYHDILWDIGYAKTWEEATVNLDNLYGERPPIEDFYEWRDLRVVDECYWYSWFIDYWMEGGLMRDIFTHKITTPEHWQMLMLPTVYTRAELDYDVVVGNDTVVTPSYDPHCDPATSQISGGCEPVAVISAENLRNGQIGKQETALIGQVLQSDQRMGQYVIAQDAWDCIWGELIQNGKGLKTVFDRPGFVESDYDFSVEMLDAMLGQLDYLINKYSSPEWNSKTTSQKIVSLITDHRQKVQTERNKANAGQRTLREQDFLGPKERRRRRRITARKEGKNAEPKKAEPKKDYSAYFRALEEKIMEKKRSDMREMARKMDDSW